MGDTTSAPRMRNVGAFFLAAPERLGDAPCAMVITLCGQKGGTGKTTVVTNVVAELLSRGRTVLLVDADSQGSARTWAAHAAEAGLSAPTIALVAGIDEYDAAAIAAWILREVPAASHLFDVVVIDCPGFLRGAHSIPAAALHVSDIAVVPTAEDAFSAWSLAASAELIRTVQRVRPQLQAFGLLQGVDARRSIAQKAPLHLDRVGLPLLRAQMLDRAEYVEAPGFLLGASTYKPKSGAAGEVRALVDELLSHWSRYAEEAARRSAHEAPRSDLRREAQRGTEAARVGNPDKQVRRSRGAHEPVDQARVRARAGGARPRGAGRKDGTRRAGDRAVLGAAAQSRSLECIEAPVVNNR